jgi:hypothetical protein
MGSPTEEAFDKKARGAMHTKREGKALSRPRFGAQFAQALIDYYYLPQGIFQLY